MPEKVLVNAFRYSELPEDARHRAQEEVGYCEFINNLLCEDLYDDLQYTHGFPVANGRRDYGIRILYSLGYSQGDGVAFDGEFYTSDVKNLKFRELLKDNGLDPDRLEDVLRVFVTHNSRYTHHNSFDVDFEWFPSDERSGSPWETHRDLCEGIEDFLRSLSRTLERNGYKYLDDYYSEEAVSDYMDSNGYRFLISGAYLTKVEEGE